MKKLKVTNIARSLRTTMAKRSPEILTGLGIAGMLTTTVLAVKATPKALKLIKDEKREEHVDKLPVKKTIKTVWKCYIPAAITGVSSTICLIGASSMRLKRNAALATAYTLTETALKEYQAKVVETIGEKKERSVREAVVKDKIHNNPVGDKEVVIVGNGTTLCCDMTTGRYFKSSMEALKKTENELNRRMRNDVYISLNEFYDEIGLRRIDIGDELGWNIDKGYIDLEFDSILDSEGTPCLAVSFRVAPRYDYSKLV